MTWHCPWCSALTLPPAVDPSNYRHCGRCGNDFEPHEAKRSGTWTLLDDVEDLIVPDDLAAAFEAAPPSRANWDAFSRSARRAILVWIVQAQRPETRAKRVTDTARRAAINEKANEPTTGA